MSKWIKIETLYADGTPTSKTAIIRTENITFVRQDSCSYITYTDKKTDYKFFGLISKTEFKHHEGHRYFLEIRTSDGYYFYVNESLEEFQARMDAP